MDSSLTTTEREQRQSKDAMADVRSSPRRLGYSKSAHHVSRFRKVGDQGVDGQWMTRLELVSKEGKVVLNSGEYMNASPDKKYLLVLLGKTESW
jgi:glutathione synthase/RimK-type ligase-like ATP-grasp enzyme